MKIIASFLCYSSLLTMFAMNDPCKSSKIPTDLHDKKVLFEIPTYEEYVKNMVKEALNSGGFIDDSKIMEEQQYNKLRNEKIQIIVTHFDGEYHIVSEQEYNGNAERFASEYGYVLKEKLMIKRIVDDNTDFKKFTNFYLLNLTSMGRFELINQEDVKSVDCLFRDKNWEYADLVTIL